MIYPNGVVIKPKTGNHQPFFIVNGKSCEFFSKRTFESWSLVPIFVDVPVDNPVGARIGFRDGTLIKNVKDGKIYLVSSGKRREVTTPDFFKSYGFKTRSVIQVSDAEANLHETGEDIN